MSSYAASCHIILCDIMPRLHYGAFKFDSSHTIFSIAPSYYITGVFIISHHALLRHIMPYHAYDITLHHVASSFRRFPTLAYTLRQDPMLYTIVLLIVFLARGPNREQCEEVLPLRSGIGSARLRFGAAQVSGGIAIARSRFGGNRERVLPFRGESGAGANVSV